MAEAEDRTESASPRRLQKAREQGDVAVSREVTLTAGLAGGSLALIAVSAATAHHAAVQLGSMLASPADPPAALARAIRLVAELVLPVAGAALVLTVAAGLLQTGLLIRPEALLPDPGRLSLGAGFRRIFGTDNLVQAGKSVVKLLALGLCLWLALRRAVPGFGPGMLAPVAGTLQQAWSGLVRIILMVLGAQAGIAALDLLWVRLAHARKLRMSRHELREEHKESEGNPHVKQRLRGIARARARRRMMAAVPKASVVVTNPTHYAVALAYERGAAGAPRVVAKGADEVAARIREVARENHIPTVANPPLARALFRIELDTEIPAEHFQAVAEIIAYVWRLRARAAR